MLEPLDEIETRVVGALVEKQLTTPEYYPLTLNALIAACNQKSNRDPVVSFDERAVSDALERLRDRNIVYVYYGSTSRVPKYKHMIPSVYELDPAGVALVCVMMLRGPQTLGELRERTGRLFQFEGLGEVQESLDGLIRRDDPLVFKLERQPGQKEARFAQLLSGEIDEEMIAATAAAARSTHSGGSSERFEMIDEEIASLKSEIEAIKQQFDEFRKQFE